MRLSLSALERGGCSCGTSRQRADDRCRGGRAVLLEKGVAASRNDLQSCFPCPAGDLCGVGRGAREVELPGAREDASLERAEPIEQGRTVRDSVELQREVLGRRCVEPGFDPGARVRMTNCNLQALTDAMCTSLFDSSSFNYY